MTLTPPTSVQQLLSSQSVRQRCREIYNFVRDGGSSHFSLDLERLPEIAATVADITRKNYPTLEIPYHSRWGHLSPSPAAKGSGATDFLAALSKALKLFEVKERLRRQIDFVTVSVLLDAGAGPDWRFRDPASSDTQAVGRSEGLALASCAAFLSGAFSSDANDPLRIDGTKLRQLSLGDLEQVFQVSASNPLAGLPGRVQLMNRLGEILCETFPKDSRPSALFQHQIEGSSKQVRASDLLEQMLIGYSTLWPSRLSLEGWSLGDTWRHSAITRTDSTSGLVPFHKLSQWLTYSLLEPFEWASYKITGLDELTGLAEYRNGGLFLDGNALVAKDAAAMAQSWKPSDEFVVEWRALTVSLLDDLRPLVAKQIGLSDSNFPLAKLLQGGTWSAGRALALIRSADGSPPLRIESDGTVF